MMRRLLIIFVFIAFVVFLSLKSYIGSKNTMRASYHFVIEDLDTTAKGQLELYSKGEWRFLHSYSITQFDSILVMDSIAKDSCEKFVRVYRKNFSDGNYQLISKHKSVSLLFNRDFFCE